MYMPNPNEETDLDQMPQLPDEFILIITEFDWQITKNHHLNDKDRGYMVTLRGLFIRGCHSIGDREKDAEMRGLVEQSERLFKDYGDASV